MRNTRITVICPEALLAQAQGSKGFAGILGSAVWRDRDGNTYAAASYEAPGEPEPGEALAPLVVFRGSGDALEPMPDKILIVRGIPGAKGMSDLGLYQELALS